MSGMTVNESMTADEHAQVMQKATALSGVFRELGPKYDTDNTFAYPSIQAFKDSGLFAVPVPKQYGGMGANILQTSKVVSELSRGDSAITLAYNMHFITVGLALSLMSEAQCKEWLGRVTDGEIMFGPISEARAGFSGLADTTAVPQPGGGWKLYGKKTWGTLCEAATIIMTTATLTDADGNLPDDFEGRVTAESVFIGDFLVDEDGRGEGIRIERTWNSLGMHATGTQTIHLEGYFVPEENFICEWRAGAFGALEWASLLFASIYLGMQYRVLEESTAVLSKKTLGATFGAIAANETKVSGIGHIVDGIGDMAARVELSRRVVHRTCQELIDGDDDLWPVELRFPYIGLAKTFCAENVMHMTRKAMSLVGGQSFRKGAIFERLYRDSAASMFQPLNSDQSCTYIGEYFLAPEELED